jgi:hypothetical protein
MKKNRKIETVLGARKVISIGIMCLCLLFLTTVNFLIYPPSQVPVASLIHSNDSNDEESPAPVEEKSSSKTGLTVQEEYIHELHLLQNLSAFVVLSKHKIPAAEKLQVVHFELDSPPPKA